MKKLKIILMFTIAITFATFFGCDKSTPVDSIFFNIGEGQHIIMLLNQELNLNEYVTVQPSFATNKHYGIESSDKSIVAVSGSTITALKEGSAIVTVTSRDDGRKQDAITVVVKRSQSTLTSPKNLTYNDTTHTFSFDAVLNASSYMVKIDTNEYNIGNCTTFSLDEINNAYDRDLSVQVRAIAPEYSFALVSSTYSDVLKINQADSVKDTKIGNGVLKFEKSIATSIVDLYINGTIISENISSPFDLNTLSLPMGEQVNLTLKQISLNTNNNVLYYASAVSEKITVLNVLSPEFSGSTLSWVGYANLKYEITLNSEKQVVTDSTIDLNKIFSGFKNLTKSDVNYSINVKTIYDDANVISNIIIPKTSSTVKFNIIDNVDFSVNKGVVSWTQVENSSAYKILIKRNDDEIVKSEVSNVNSFDLKNKDAGNYSFAITAIASGYKDGVYYLSSATATRTVYKNSSPTNLKIENYKLTFTAEEGCTCKIYLDGTAEDNCVKDTDIREYDLSNFEFSAGSHFIKIVSCGDDNAFVNSNISEPIEFVQLEKIEKITISNSQVQVTRSDINNDAKIVLITYRTDGTLMELFEIEGDNYAYNSTESNVDNYLLPGDYKTTVKILGDGSKTFSYREKITDENAEVKFKVLPAPEQFSFDKETNKLTVGDTQNAKFFADLSGKIISTNGNAATISLNPGDTVKIGAQAVGDGSTTLTSIKSEKEVTISKLNNPTLSFNKSTGIVTRTSDVENAVSYQSFPDDYDFGSAYAFAVGENVFKMKAIAKADVDGTYYLNSNETELKVTKLNSSAEFSLTSDGKLEILSEENEKYDIVLTLNYKGTNHVFASKNEKLVCSDESLDYSYSNKKYIVTLVKADYSYVLNDFDAFTATIQYVASSENVLSSDTSESSSTFEKANSLALDRENQSLCSNVDALSLTNNPVDYLLVVNGIIKELYSIGSGWENGFSLDINGKLEMPYTTLCSLISGEATSVLIITKKENSLPVKSNEIKTKKATKLTWQYLKDNSQEQEDNSAYIYFETQKNLSYDVSYMVNSPSDTDTPYFNREFVNGNAVENKISIRLDSIETLVNLYGSFEFYATVLAKGKDSDGETEVFNSDSVKQVVNKISPVTDIKVSNTTVSFEKVANAIGYEIYELAGSDKIKIGFINSTSFKLTEAKTIYIRAISNNDNGNSNAPFSSAIVVEKLSSPTVDLTYGDFIIMLNNQVATLMENSDSSISLVVANGDVVKNYKLEYVMVEEKKFLQTTIAGKSATSSNLDSVQLLAYDLLTYNGTENLSFKYSVESPAIGGTYYIDSGMTEKKDLVGVNKATNIKKTTNSDNTDIENISWVNSNGTDVEVGYYFVFAKLDDRGNQDGPIYSSIDSSLKYLNGGSRCEYPELIENTYCNFPVAYENSADDITYFGAGKYAIAVRTMVKASSSTKITYCASNYSDWCYVEILPEPEVTIKEGSLSWSHIPNATYYVVKDDYDNTCCIQVYNSPSVITYNFSSADFGSGKISVRVMAGSTKSNVVNSKYSVENKIYRLSTPASLSTDDGCLVLNAQPYFKSAKIYFVDNNGDTQVINYNNLTRYNQSTESKDISRYDLSSEDFIISSDSNSLNIDANKQYKIKIQLLGDDNNIVNSSMTDIGFGNLCLTKLKTNINEISAGVIKYQADDIYLLDNKININCHYQFGETAENLDFWSNVVIYNIQIQEISNNIYAVDYQSFVDNQDKLTEGTHYGLLTNLGNLYAWVRYGNLMFNVFKENKLDLSNYQNLWYYEISQSIENGQFVYSSETTYKTKDLNECMQYHLSIHLMGGDNYTEDSDDKYGYLTADSEKFSTFIRYNLNTLSTKDGKLCLIDQSVTYSQGENNIIDYPVYKIMSNYTDENRVEQEVVVYAYYDYLSNTELSLAKAMEIAKSNDSTKFIKIELKEIKNQTTQEIVKYCLVDVSNHFYEKAQNNVKVQTLAGGTNGMDLNYINSLETGRKAFYLYSTIGFEVKAGILSTAVSKTTINDIVNSCEKYQVEITCNGKTEIQILNRSTKGIYFDMNGNMTYELPNSINSIEFKPGVKYSINIKPLGNDLVLNGKISSDLEFEKSESVVNARIENGIVCWDEFASCLIRFAYKDKDQIEKTISCTASGTSFDVTEQGKTIDYSTENTLIDSNKEYTVYIYAVENGKVYSNYAIIENVKRLNSVANIKTENGILTWDEVENAVKYYVKIGSEFYGYVRGTSFAVPEDVVAGNYQVSIRAIGDDEYISAITTYSDDYKKFNVPTNLKIENGILTWDAVDGASKYGIVVGDNSEIIAEQPNYYGEFTESVKIKVRALGTGDKEFNSDYCDEITVSNTTPSPISNLSFDADKDSILWQMNEFLDNDSVVISYKLLRYNKGQNASNTSETVKEKMFKYNNKIYLQISRDNAEYSDKREVGTLIIDGKTYYYLKLTVIGKYSEISVQVHRDGATSSAVVCYNQEIDFDIYAYGSGLSDDAYGIESINQFININKFSSCYFELNDVIDIANLDFNNYKSSDGKICLVKEFSGTFNGNNEKFYNSQAANDKNYTWSFSELTQFSLFGSLKSAKIKNFDIGEKENLYKFVYSFANSNTNDVLLSIVAGETQDSTIENVNVPNAQIEINSNVASLKLGAISANAVNSTFNNCYANLTVVTSTINSDKSYVAGLVGMADNCNFDWSPNKDEEDVVFTIKTNTTTSSNNCYVGYVGAVCAYFKATDEDANKIYKLSNITTKITTGTNLEIQNCGGIVGYLGTPNSTKSRQAQIENCKSMCDYGHNSAGCKCGGIVAWSVRGIIKGCTASMSITLESSNNNTAIGLICGNLVETQINYTGEYNIQTNLSQNVLGIYGTIDSKSRVSQE